MEGMRIVIIFEEEFVRVDLDNGIAILHLTRPPMNALNLQMQQPNSPYLKVKHG